MLCQVFCNVRTYNCIIKMGDIWPTSLYNNDLQHLGISWAEE